MVGSAVDCHVTMQQGFARGGHASEASPHNICTLHAPVTSRMVRPVSAAATALTPMAPPKIQRPTVMAKAPAVIFSSVLMGPSLASSSRACRQGGGRWQDKRV